MITRVFAVFDSAAQAYLAPFTLPAKGMAIRGFTDAVNNDQTEFSKHPEDYHLFEFGTFDDNTGIYDLHAAPQPLGNGLEYVQNLKTDNVLKLQNEEKSA